MGSRFSSTNAIDDFNEEWTAENKGIDYLRKFIMIGSCKVGKSMEAYLQFNFSKPCKDRNVCKIPDQVKIHCKVTDLSDIFCIPNDAVKTDWYEIRL